jgi:histone acetyltransferase (RNA polymerase elongator complex component)
LHLIIPIFIMHRGCPHRCIFCNVRKTAGNHPERLSEDAFCETVNKYLGSSKERPDRVQIAFYGGNFTGMEKAEQIEFLTFARLFIKKGVVNNIRISTRPDCIDTDSLDMLKAFDVTTVEIGAQSMVDEVLNLANRGHSSADVANSMKLLKERGFETAMHLMVGLPGDIRSSFENTVEKTIALQPDSVRIHPTLVFEDTDLAKAYLNGNYAPLSLHEAVELCKFALRKFEEACIPIIRLGLHTTREMETPGSIIAGPHHPAFRSFVEESLYFDMASSLLAAERVKNRAVTFILSPKDVSSFRGHKNKNLQRLKKRFGLADIRVSVDPCQTRRSLNIMIHDGALKSAFPDNIEQGTSIV